MMKNTQILENVMLDLGHDFRCIGTDFLMQAAGLYEPGMRLTKELYPALALANDTTAGAVERAMRHSIDKAWTDRCSLDSRSIWFGNSINPETGRPTPGEYVARLARIIRQAEGHE